MESKYSVDTLKQPISEIDMKDYNVVHSGKTNDIIFNDKKLRIGLLNHATGIITWINIKEQIKHFEKDGFVKINSVFVGLNAVFVVINEKSTSSRDFYKSCVSIDTVFNINKIVGGGGYEIDSSHPFQVSVK